MHRIFRQLSGHVNVLQHFFRTIGSQIALRQTFEKRRDFLRRLRSKCLQPGDAVVVLGLGMDALVGGAAHAIGSRNIELPNVLSLPRGKRLGIYRLDVSIGKQA